MEKKTLILTLSLLFISSLVFAETIPTKSGLKQKSQRQEVLEFLNKLNSITTDFTKKKEGGNYEELFNAALSKRDTTEARRITLDKVSIIRQHTKQIEELPAPENCRNFKELFIKMDEITVEVEMAFLEAEIAPLNIKAHNEATDLVMQQLECSRKLLSEKNRVLQEYNIKYDRKNEKYK